jgi:hypothetical protein
MTSFVAASFCPPSLVVASPPPPSFPAASGAVSSLELEPHARTTAETKK